MVQNGRVINRMCGKCILKLKRNKGNRGEAKRNDKNNKVIKRQNLYKMKRDEAVGVRCMFRRKKDKTRTYFDAHTSYGS